MEIQLWQWVQWGLKNTSPKCRNPRLKSISRSWSVRAMIIIFSLMEIILFMYGHSPTTGWSIIPFILIWHIHIWKAGAHRTVCPLYLYIISLMGGICYKKILFTLPGIFGINNSLQVVVITFDITFKSIEIQRWFSCHAWSGWKIIRGCLRKSSANSGIKRAWKI